MAEETTDGLLDNMETVQNASDGEWFTDLLGMDDAQLDKLKQLGASTMEAFNAI